MSHLNITFVMKHANSDVKVSLMSRMHNLLLVSPMHLMLALFFLLVKDKFIFFVFFTSSSCFAFFFCYSSSIFVSAFSPFSSFYYSILPNICRDLSHPTKIDLVLTSVKIKTCIYKNFRLTFRLKAYCNGTGLPCA